MGGSEATRAGPNDGHALVVLARYRVGRDSRLGVHRVGDKAFEGVDAIVTPTSPTAAFKVGEKSEDPLQMYLSDIFTLSCNLSGFCGISVPCGLTKSPKLPIGLQLLGRPFGEESILRIAHAYERATKWHKAKPAL